jgi:hypothetical protein
MGSAMLAKELRDNAQECLDWARTAHSEREREIFLQMAQTWLELAIRAEHPPSNGTIRNGTVRVASHTQAHQRAT